MKGKKRAVALNYDGASSAPMVTATGVGHIADKIIEKAEEQDVPIVYNKELTELMSNMDIGDAIPEELYEAVAEIIAYVAELDRVVER